MRSIVLFGGTFDPIHVGHTTVAAFAARHLHAEYLIFVPAGRSPLKDPHPMASGEHRLNMIDLAIAGHTNWQASDCELKRPQPSYSLDTVRHFRAMFGSQACIYWLIGADCAKDLQSWYRIEELLQECTIVTMTRPGTDKPDYRHLYRGWSKEQLEKLQRHVIETPMVDVSSTVIRQRIAAGQDVGGMLYPAVLQYIHIHRLYR